MLSIWTFSSCSEQGLLFVSGLVILIAVASLVGKYRLQAHKLSELSDCDSQALEHRLSSCGPGA